MKIIDIHAHVYPRAAGITNGVPLCSERLGRAKAGNKLIRLLPPSFEDTSSRVEVLLAYMEICGIDRAILMQNPLYGYHNDYFAECVKKYPSRFRGVALVDMLNGRAAAEELSQIFDEGILEGFKIETLHTFQCAPHIRMTDSEVRPVWECCNEYAQSVFIHPFRNCDIEDISILVKKYEKIRFVICHMGADAAFGDAASIDNFRILLEMVKTHKNVYVDTSTVPVYFSDAYPFPQTVRIIENAYNTVGAEKLMWASDYPGMLNHATMQQLLDIILNGCKSIPIRDKELIMAGNADRLFFGKTVRSDSADKKAD